MPPALPLFEVFSRLREHGLPLGVPEYQAVLQALHTGVGYESYEALARLCCTVWVKSQDEMRLFYRLFDQFLQTLPTAVAEAEPPVVPQSPEQEEVPARETEQQPAPEPSPAKRQPPNLPRPAPTLEIDEPVQVVQAIRHSAPHNEDLPRPRFLLLTEYFPVTRRQMKQSWRYLRRSVREGPPGELDIGATIEKISREGLLLEPVLMPRRINRAELVLLLDQDGSMVPFHSLTRQLVETLQRGGRLGQAGVFYFHDYPDGFLYRDAARVEAIAMDDALGEIGEKAVVLIVSDAGAARGAYDRERITRTHIFITQLRQAVRRCAWLNPMPRTRWFDTSANQIKQLLPMFEMSRHGLDAAINALRGRYV